MFKKYLLTFNQDSKMIGIYKQIINHNDIDIIIDDSDNSNDKNSKHSEGIENKNKSNNMILIIGIVVLLLILIILIFIFVKQSNNCYKKQGSKNNNNYHKGNVAYDSKNKNITHEYYELENNLIN